MAHRAWANAKCKGAASALLLALIYFVSAGACGFSPGFTRLSPAPRPTPAKPTPFLAASECQICHPKQYEEWRTSMHAYAQYSPVFIAFNEFVLKSSGGSLGSFCDRCHSPMGLAAGESPIEKDSERSASALDSVGCIVCHSQHMNNNGSSGVFTVPVDGDPSPVIYGPYYGSDEPGRPNDPAQVLIKTPHTSRKSDYITSAELCGNCHDVFSPDGFRIEEAYSEWKNGPYAREGTVCQHCHMGPIAGQPFKRSEFIRDYIVDPSIFPDAPKRYRSNHRFTGPDYSLIANFGKSDLNLDDHAFAELEKQLEEERRTLIRHAPTMEVDAPSTATPGAEFDVHVAVTNSGAGHNFPTGFASERQAWLAVTVHDAAGRQLFASGDLDPNTDLRDFDSEYVQEGTVPYDWDLLNFEAAFVNRSFRGNELENISTVNLFVDPVPFVTPPREPTFITGFPFAGRIFKRGVPPRKTKSASYSIDVPGDVQGPLTLSVNLKYRNLPPHFLRGLGVGHLVPDLRTFDVKSYQSEIRVEDRAARNDAG